MAESRLQFSGPRIAEGFLDGGGQNTGRQALVLSAAPASQGASSKVTPLEKECAICGDAPTQKNPIETLRENRIGVQGFHEEIRLCKACLGRREAKSWNAAGTQGRRLQDALEAQSEPPQGHYTFLQDDQKIHLVRLRPTWLAEHAAAVTS